MNKPDDWRTALVTFPKRKVTAIQARRGALEKKIKKILVKPE